MRSIEKALLLFALFCARAPRFKCLKEVVALVVDENEGGEVLDLDLPDGLHTKFGILHALNRLDARLRQDGSHTTDRAEIEAAVLLAGISDDL